jgi:hypothetical protein
MGIGRAAVGVLLEKAAAGPFFGRDLQRSAHHLSDRSGGGAKQFARFGFRPVRHLRICGQDFFTHRGA